MQINTPNLQNLRIGFKATFQGALDQAKPLWDRVGMEVPSTAGRERYGWMGKFPSVRKWVGDRVIHNIGEHDYTLKNEDFEVTVGVDRNDILDDTLGVYRPIFQGFGESVAAWPDELIFGLLAGGFTNPCYDGQNFFDTDHPVVGKDGKEVSVANTDGGSGTPWFLLDTTKPIKPLIWQLRNKGDFVALDDPTNPSVFLKKEFLYGWDGRGNAGYAFWQMAFGGRAALDKASYKNARESMMSLTGDHGRPLNINPRLLVVPPSLEGNALEILNAERDAAGATNVYRGTAELLVVPWLA